MRAPEKISKEALITNLMVIIAGAACVFYFSYRENQLREEAGPTVFIVPSLAPTTPEKNLFQKPVETETKASTREEKALFEE